MINTNQNIHPIFDRLLQREDRERRIGQHSKVLWLTGLSGSGKSTIALELERKLFNKGFFPQVLDGDNIRTGINGNLGFSIEDRQENIRRIGNVAKLFLDTGIIVLTAFISPFQVDRESVRNLVLPGDFLEIYCNSPLEICEQRDVKGIYKKAREGIIKDFTGISSPYEAPLNPELIVNTGEDSLEDCVTQVMGLLKERGIIS